MIAAAMPKPRNSARHGGAFETSPLRGFGEVSIAPHQPHSPRSNAPLPGDWHDTCHNTYKTRARGNGVAAHLPERTGRGGARNRADRESHALTGAQIGNLKAAERHAGKIGLPFTRMISIHWQAAGVPLAGMVKATGRYTDLIAKALARHGSGTAWLWTHENCGLKGGHCHLLAHVPADLVTVVTALQRGWLRRITGKPYRARVIYSRPIGKRLGAEVCNPSDHAINLEAALAYVLKGASPEAASRFALERLEPGGRVIGKRCGTSQNIGAKARKAKD
jgi:hypothetical protein